jgi:hypothetical protein
VSDPLARSASRRAVVTNLPDCDGYGDQERAENHAGDNQAHALTGRESRALRPPGTGAAASTTRSAEPPNPGPANGWPLEHAASEVVSWAHVQPPVAANTGSSTALAQARVTSLDGSCPEPGAQSLPSSEVLDVTDRILDHASSLNVPSKVRPLVCEINAKEHESHASPTAWWQRAVKAAGAGRSPYRRQRSHLGFDDPLLLLRNNHPSGHGERPIVLGLRTRWTALTPD